MDWEQFVALMSGRPQQGQHSVTQIGQAYDTQVDRQQREQGRQEYMQRVNAPPPPPTDDLFAILQRNLANPDSQNPQLQALRAAAQQDIAPVQDMVANAQSDVAALEMQPPLAGRGPEITQASLLSGFAPEPAQAAPPMMPQTPPEAQKHIQMPQLPEPPQQGKPGPAITQTYAGRPVVIGPSAVSAEPFIPPEALPPRSTAPRASPVIDPRRPVIGPGGATGEPIPFGSGLNTGLQLGPQPALAPASQEPFRIDWPMGQGPAPAPAPVPQAAQPTTAPGPDMSTILNQQELARFMAASAAPAPSKPPPAPEVPPVSAPRAAPVPQAVPLPAGAAPPTNTPPAPMPNEQIPPHLKDQLLQEAIRITRSQRNQPASIR